MREQHILVVDDDTALGELLSDYLGKFGYTLTVKTLPSEGLAALTAKDFAVAIFDVMLPEMDGFALCKAARQIRPHLPIMMLTARGDLTDRVVGLEMGADDYLPKPFEPRELAARLTALLRRTTFADAHLLTFTGLKIDLAARRVWLAPDNREVVLTALEFRLLYELIKNRPDAVSRDTLIEKLRGFERDVFDRSVDITISRLRAKLGCSPRQPKFIKTIHAEGYAFIATLRV